MKPQPLIAVRDVPAATAMLVDLTDLPALAGRSVLLARCLVTVIASVGRAAK